MVETELRKPHYGMDTTKIGGRDAVIDHRTGNLIVWLGDTQHVMPVTAERVEARLTLMQAAGRCPDPRSFPTFDAYEAAFHLYQRTVMDPLRAALADIVAADEKAFIEDLKEVYA